MPCNSDYMEPTQREQELQETAKVYVHVRQSLGMQVSDELARAANASYCATDYTAALCETLRALSKPAQRKVMSDIGNPMHRATYEWWERHKKADEARLRLEREKRFEDATKAMDLLRMLDHLDLADELMKREAKRNG